MEYPKDLFKYGEPRTVKDSSEEAKARAEGFTEPYKYQEFPKHLYLNGDRTGTDKVVASLEEETAARAAGFRMIGEPEPTPAQEPQEATEGGETATAQPKAKKSK